MKFLRAGAAKPRSIDAVKNTIRKAKSNIAIVDVMSTPMLSEVCIVTIKYQQNYASVIFSDAVYILFIAILCPKRLLVFNTFDILI